MVKEKSVLEEHLVRLEKLLNTLGEEIGKLQKNNQILQEIISQLPAVKKEPEGEKLRRPLDVEEIIETFNRHYFDLKLEEELRRAERYYVFLSLLFLELDDFTNISQSSPREVIKSYFKQITRILREMVRRKIDVALKLSGPRFVIILPETNEEEVMALAERIRQRIAKYVYPWDGRRLQTTVSIGVVTYPSHAKTKEELLTKGEEALKKALAAGGNTAIKTEAIIPEEEKK